MRKGNRLSWKDFLILTHPRQFPYLSRIAISHIHFNTRDYDGSYPDKVLRKLESKPVGLLRRVWTGLNTWAYAITPEGSRTIEMVFQDDWQSLKKGSTKTHWMPPLHQDLGFKSVSEKKIAFNFPKDHTLMCARFWYYFPKPQNLLFMDLLKPNSRQELGFKSSPDFIDLETKVAFEIENTVASPSRKYQKIRSLFPDRNRIKFFVFLFKDEAHMTKYLTKEGWNLFLNKEYTPVGKPAHWKVKHVTTEQLTFSTRRFLFGVFPKKKGDELMVKKYRHESVMRIEKDKTEYFPISYYLDHFEDSNNKVAPD